MRKWDMGSVGGRWREQYHPKGFWRNDTSWRNGESATTDREAIHALIVAANGDAGKIESAIGNRSWTSFLCVECLADKISGVTFDNGDGGEVTICAECLKKSLALG